MAATVGTVALGAAAAGAAGHVVALGQSAIVAASAVALMPAALAGAVGFAVAAKVAFGGLGEAWKQTGAAAAAGGGATVDIARQVEIAQRSVRNATTGLADAQRDALNAQEALARAREDEAERLSDLTRSLASARLSEREAILAVNQAKARMASTSRGGDRGDIESARLAYQRSLLTLDEVRDRVSDLSKEQTEANSKGVEGSDAVQSAVRRQEESQRSLTAATERLADAQRDLAQAGKGVGGAADKAAQALAALAPNAAALIVTLRALGPAWTAAGKGGQQQAFAGVAADFRRLSEVYLPMTTTWFGRMGAAFNDSMRSTFKLATTAEFARDVDEALNGIAATTATLGATLRPFVNGFMQFVVVGSQLLPGIAGEVGNLAGRFERWAIAARESGKMQEWMTTGWATLKQFGAVARDVVMTVVAIFSAGENTGTLDGLVKGAAAMRAWAESAEGQAQIKEVLTFLRNILTDIAAIVPAFTGNSGALTDTLSVLGVVVGFLADHMEALAAWMPTILAGFLVWKTLQAGANAAMLIAIPLRVAEFVGQLQMTAAMWAHSAALRANTLAMGTNTGATVVGTTATTAGDVAAKRSLLSMAAMKAAQMAGAVATGIATAAQWLWNVALSANPIGLVIIGITALIAVIVLIATKTTWFQDAWKVSWGWIKKTAADVWDWLKGLPDKIGDTFKSVANFITSPFRTAFNAISGLWNSTIGQFSWTLPDWLPFGIGGKTIHAPKLPTIPALDVGGRVLETGIALIHKGEDVVPAAEVRRRDSGGGASAQRSEHVLRSDGTAMSDWVLEMVRKAVGQRGGDVVVVVNRTG